MDLDTMKYAELRSLAKELGLKANMKADKLLKAIKQHYEKQQQQEDGQINGNDVVDAQENNNSAEDIVQEEKDATSDETFPSTKLFVTERRGRRTKAKRKISDTETATVCDSILPLGAAEDNEPAESTAPSGSGRSKRRRVSPTVDSGTSGPPEVTPAINDEQQPDNKVPALCDEGNETKVAKAGKIPRHEGLLKKNKRLLKPITPNFKKLHEAHFNKMESIDSYVQRKTKQMDTYRNSVKELKMLSENTILKPAERKTQVKANLSRASMFSPAVEKKSRAPDKQRASALPAGKPAQKEDAPFRPSVLSTRRINVRFSQATQDNEHKRSLVKTPARLSVCVASSTPGKQNVDERKPNVIKTSNVSATKTPGTFVFSANTSVSNTPGTNKKPSFDLKASLSRPLTYKPHTGKLKPFADAKESTAANKSLISQSHQKNYKQHQVQTRAERRDKHNENRKQKKRDMLGARRGLVMS
ncbi:nucleolar and spindle-associated protein 1 [Polymixia lowei]